MWKHRNGRHRAKKICRHGKTKTSSAGLELVVCETCGQISLRYLRAVIEDDIYIPNEPDPEVA